jgi:isopenicillin N synthase-like dioxygenase
MNEGEGYARAIEVPREAVPVIDVGALASGDLGDLARIGREIRRASAEIGFFYVRDHGVPDALTAAADRTARAYFARPMADKLACKTNARHRGFLAVGEARMYGREKVDLKESFVWGLELSEDDPDVRAGRPLMGPNQWPVDMPELRRDLYGWFEGMTGLGHRLLRAIAAGFDVDPGFFAPRFRKPLARGSAIHYPPQPPDLGARQFGVAPHTDYGCLTLLWQDEVGGLQVKGVAGEWVAAPPMPGTFVINVGDLLARWTGDRLRSNPHRVVNESGRARHSMAVFFDADHDCVVDPNDLGIADGAAPIACGDYIKMRFDEAFAYRKRG